MPDHIVPSSVTRIKDRAAVVLTGKKACTVCGVIKPLSDYPANSTKPDGCGEQCKPCKAARQVASRYGLTVAEYRDMSASQGDVCAICGKPEVSRYREKVRELAVDHDHESGKIRGLLCNFCNRMLGLARDDIGILIAAAEYLETHGLQRSA